MCAVVEEFAKAYAKEKAAKATGEAVDWFVKQIRETSSYRLVLL